MSIKTLHIVVVFGMSVSCPVSAALAAASRVDQLCNCGWISDHVRDAAVNNLAGIKTLTISESATFVVLGLTFWAGYIRHRTMLSNTPFALLNHNFWFDICGNIDELTAVTGANSTSLDANTIAISAPAAVQLVECVTKDALPISTTLRQGKQAEDHSGSEVDLPT